MTTTTLSTNPGTGQVVVLQTRCLRPNPFSLSLYGDPAGETDDLLPSIREHGVLVPLVVVPDGADFALLSGHRRLACARLLELDEVPCIVRDELDPSAQKHAILEYNRQRHKNFSQLMREADALESLFAEAAEQRRLGNLVQFRRNEEISEDLSDRPECRNPDDRAGRTDDRVARALGLGGKDLYRQARAIWQAAREGDIRAQSGVTQLDAGTRTIHAAYKDLRRRNRFTANFRPTPYDVWAFKHDRAFGIPHPGAIPPGIVAHTLHYFTKPGDLVVDPMAGGGTTLDVCQSMGRRCLAYDVASVRPDVTQRDVNNGYPSEASGCDLVFCDPPYHTMLAGRYAAPGVAEASLADWVAFLKRLAETTFAVLRPGGYLALLLATQTEKDLPVGHGYIDHVFLGYSALMAAGFLPERRISCPMDGSYLPQHVRRARTEGRMLGQVRDLLVVRKPLS